jgi:23S rRNA (cytosine1962-C5)-methyltransferase
MLPNTELEEQRPAEDEDDEEEDIGFTVPLSRTYAAREGAPIVTHVAPRIFVQTYFQTCFECGFCNDSCCQYGVAVDLPNQARINAHAAANQASTGIDAIEADVFRFLETATPGGYDLVVIDPPKFARARKDLDAARKGYERLNALALTALAPGGVLVTCSCSQNVDAVEFERIVAAGGKQANRAVRVTALAGAAPDHIMPAGFTEGQYLKVIFAVAP